MGDGATQTACRRAGRVASGAYGFTHAGQAAAAWSAGPRGGTLGRGLGGLVGPRGGTLGRGLPGVSRRPAAPTAPSRSLAASAAQAARPPPSARAALARAAR